MQVGRIMVEGKGKGAADKGAAADNEGEIADGGWQIRPDCVGMYGLTCG
jgi:hypothetical protein